MLDFMRFKFPAIQRSTSAPRLCLVRDGKMLRRNMRREFITDEELNAKIRHEGVDDIATVKRMYLEADGEMSLIRKEEPTSAARTPGCPNQLASKATNTSAALSHCARVTSRCVTARTVRGPKALTSTPRSRARALSVGASSEIDAGKWKTTMLVWTVPISSCTGAPARSRSAKA